MEICSDNVKNRNIALFVGYGGCENIVHNLIRKKILPQRKDTEIIDVKDIDHLERIIDTAKTATRRKKSKRKRPHKIIILKPKPFWDDALSFEKIMKSRQGRDLFHNGRFYNFSVLMIIDRNRVFIDVNMPIVIRAQFDLWCIQLKLLENMKSHSDLKLNYDIHKNCPIDHTLPLENICKNARWKEMRAPMHSCILQAADETFPRILRKWRSRFSNIEEVFHSFNVLNAMKKRKRIPKGLAREILMQIVNVEKYLVVSAYHNRNYRIIDFLE